LALDDFPQPGHHRRRRFLLHQLRVIDLAAGIIQNHDQVIPALIPEPAVMTAVDVQQQARQGPSFAPLAMHPTLAAFGHQTGALQGPLDPGVAPADAVLLPQLLVKMLHVQIEILFPVEPQHSLHLGQRDALGRRPAPPPVEQPVIAKLFVALMPAPHLPIADADDLGCLPPRDLLRQGPQNHFLYLHRPLHCGLRVRIHAWHGLLLSPPEKRTDHVLSQPDISCATDTTRNLLRCVPDSCYPDRFSGPRTPMTKRSVLVFFAWALLSLPVGTLAEDTKPPENPDLVAANQSFQSGNFADAILMYQHALKTDPKLVPAQAGLVRAYLRQEQVDTAFELATSSLAAQPNSALLLAAMGAVQYRRGEFPESEKSFLSSRKIDPNLVQTYLGLARLYRTASFYRRAYDQVKRAHEIAPQDPDVQRAWLSMLPRRDRMKALEAYLASPHPDDAEETAALRSWLEYLKATAGQPVHSCRLANNIESTETQMQILLRDTRRMSGYGLLVKINDHNQRLLLDTGASGILIN